MVGLCGFWDVDLDFMVEMWDMKWDLELFLVFLIGVFVEVY